MRFPLIIDQLDAIDEEPTTNTNEHETAANGDIAELDTDLPALTYSGFGPEFEPADDASTSGRTGGTRSGTTSKKKTRIVDERDLNVPCGIDAYLEKAPMPKTLESDVGGQTSAQAAIEHAAWGAQYDYAQTEWQTGYEYIMDALVADLETEFAERTSWEKRLNDMSQYQRSWPGQAEGVVREAGWTCYEGIRDGPSTTARQHRPRLHGNCCGRFENHAAAWALRWCPAAVQGTARAKAALLLAPYLLMMTMLLNATFLNAFPCWANARCRRPKAER
jgi:hypothetical protein